MATACDSLEVDLSRTDLEVTWETQPCIDVEVEQTDITIEAVTVANQGPKGDTGAQGPIGPPGTPGTPGEQGLPGAAATVAAGATVTTAPGSNAAVTNSGTSSAAVFNFAIPQGAIGAAGPQGLPGNTGAQGSPGPQGQTGLQGPKGDPGAQGATGNTGAQGNPGATGAQGPQGNQGTTGQPAYTISSAGFTVPAVGSSVTVTAADTSWATVGEVLWIQDAGGPGVAGPMQVSNKTPTSLTLRNIASAPLPSTSLGVFIESPSNKTYTLELEAGSNYILTKLSIKTASGTCTTALQINGAPVTGASAVAVSATLTTITLNQAVAAGDSITLAISGNASAVDLSASVRVQP